MSQNALNGATVAVADQKPTVDPEVGRDTKELTT